MKARFITHTVGVGDTIQGIAARYGVNWTKLAVVNGLTYPYIDSELNSTANDGNDEVAKIGSRLVIPTLGLNIPNKTNNKVEELEAYTFGADLDLFSTMTSPNGVTNLEALGELTDDPDTRDINICKGINNLRQQIIIRLGTPKGSLMLHPEWGCNLTKMIGGRMTMERLIKIKLEVQECVLGDFRVLGISDMRAIFANSGKRDVVFKGEGTFHKAVNIDFIVHPIDPYDVFRVNKTFSM